MKLTKVITDQFKEMKEAFHTIFEAENSFWPFVFWGVFKSLIISCILLVAYYLPVLIVNINKYSEEMNIIDFMDILLISSVLIFAFTVTLIFIRTSKTYFERASRKQASNSNQLAQWSFYFICGFALILLLVSSSPKRSITSIWDFILVIPFMVAFALAVWQFQKQMRNLPIAEIKIDNRFIFKGLKLGILGAILGSFLFMTGEILYIRILSGSITPPSLSFEFYPALLLFLMATFLSFVPGGFGGIFLSYVLFRRFVNKKAGFRSNIFIGMFIGAITGLLICLAFLSIFSGSAHGPNIEVALAHTIWATSISGLMSGWAASRLNNRLKTLS